jgi:DtxR family Mn-dependent transcriptional regulator
MVSEITEQYLKIIYNLTEGGGVARTNDIAGTLEVAPASVTEMLHKLAEQGYISHTPYKGVVLRSKGKRIACKVARRHRLLERFLADVVGTKGKSVHEQACKMEHALTDDAEKSLCHLLNHPQTCPGGRSIPKCQRSITCDKCAAGDVPLSEIAEGEKAVVSHLVAESKDELCSMLAMGFVPGSEVKVEKRVPMGGPIIVSLKGTKVAIARDRGDVLHVVRAA